MISDKVKNIIFKFLSDELKNSEIINYNGNIWFIDREKKYWYFELQKDGRLWWRYSFFNDFFFLFSLDSARFEPILKDWVEEVLNCKVNTTVRVVFFMNEEVEEVLNCKVNTTSAGGTTQLGLVEEVLNCKVNTTVGVSLNLSEMVEDVLNHTVTNMEGVEMIDEESYVDKVLNHTIK